MLHQIELNLGLVTSGILVHGVNCEHVMGAGVALVVKNTWPEVYQRYLSMPTGCGMLGQIDPVQIREDFYVVNAYTQTAMAKPGFHRAASTAAIQQCLQSLGSFNETKRFPIYLPQIGCGLGGLSWEKEVKPILDTVLEKYPEQNWYVCTKPPITS